MATNESSSSQAEEVNSSIGGLKYPLPSDLICRCTDLPKPSRVHCPLCRAPAVWCSIKCAEAHLRACAISRAEVGQSVRLSFPRTPDHAEPIITCCVCGGGDVTPAWIRCGICYNLKWCSMKCYASDPSHYTDCFKNGRDKLETAIIHAEPVSDQQLLQAEFSADNHLYSARDACALCGQMTWAWTPTGGAKSKTRATLPSLMVHVQVISDAAKNEVLRDALDQMKARQRISKTLLWRLKHLDPLVANRFRLKSKPASNFVLRFAHPIFTMSAMSGLTGTASQDRFDWPLALLRSSSHLAHADAGQTATAASFIAVSYCWHHSSWSLADTLTDIGSPVAIEMWQAILNFRISDDEGVWLDQLCINQDDEDEKQEAISAMDLIYQSARLVMVIIEDISLHSADIEFLGEAFDLHDEDNRSQVPAIASQFFVVFKKILKARWFSRAWCMHEHLSAANAMLLIPIQDQKGGVGEVSLQNLLKVNDWIIFLSPHISTDESSTPLRAMTKQLMGIHPGHDSLVDVIENKKDGKILNYSEILARCLAMNAAIETDKVAIALNISKLGLALNTLGLSVDDCCYAFSLLTFVAGDWSCLCNKGSFLSSEITLASPFSDLPGAGSVSSWLQKPTLKETLVEIPIPRGDLQLPQSGMEASFTRLHLQMKFLSGEWTWSGPTEKNLEASQEFVNSALCASILTITAESSIVDSSLETLKMCLACVLECGLSWIRHLFERIVSKHSKLFPIQFQGFQEPESKGKNRELAYKSGESAASILFPSTTSSEREESSLSLVWLITFLYHSNKPYMWILTSKDKRFACLCDRAPTAVANMKIGIPSMLAGPEYTLFDRVWVGTVDQDGCFIPRMKLRGIGFGDDLPETSDPWFWEVLRVRVRGPHSQADQADTALLENVRAQLEAAGLSDDSIADTLNPDRQYGKTSHLATLDLNFDFSSF